MTTPASPTRDPSLGEMLRRFAFAQLPSRFYSLLQLSAPLALQAWTAGWHRTAGWLFASSCFGLWALAQQRIQGHADLVGPQAPPSRAWILLRRAAATVTALTIGVLVAEGFAQIMARIFNCPGCAG